MALKPVPKDNKGLGKLPTEVRNKMGYMAVGGPVRQTIEVKSDKTAGPKGYRQKTSETFYRDKSTGGKFVNTKDKPRKPQRMENGGQVDPTKFTGSLKGNFKRLAGNAIQSLYNMTFPKEEREKLQKIQKDDLDKYYLDKEKKRKKREAGKQIKKTVSNVIRKKQGGEVKGGTSSQMSGQNYKGIF